VSGLVIGALLQGAEFPHHCDFPDFQIALCQMPRGKLGLFADWRISPVDRIPRPSGRAMSKLPIALIFPTFGFAIDKRRPENHEIRRNGEFPHLIDFQNFAPAAARREGHASHFLGTLSV
jgi:hypothetical protein